jgi:hypothetical protein
MSEKIIITAESNSQFTVSDGFHTFEELYEHRFALFILMESLRRQV